MMSDYVEIDLHTNNNFIGNIDKNDWAIFE
jgi:hypothetical protein